MHFASMHTKRSALSIIFVVKRTLNTSQSTLTYLSSMEVIKIENTTCPYCGTKLAKDTIDKEHVIARRFVPRGKLDRSWNLIVNSCRSCNRIKADLENDISAITMQPDAVGRFGHSDPTGRSEAMRKAEHAYSRIAEKLVKNSHVQTKVHVSFAHNASASFGFVGPPQLDRNRVYALAQLQLMAFFYWITFCPEEGRGGWWIGEFYPIIEVNRADWGNPVILAFTSAVVDWEPRLLASTRDGFYKVAIRKHPSSMCWSWALEWNHALRLIGFFGDGKEVQPIVEKFPKVEWRTMPKKRNTTVRYRRESPLPADSCDKLFYWDKRVE